jgi:acetylornithine deacetylase/succinyl-diaminopimelate desuccinylase-like protein
MTDGRTANAPRLDVEATRRFAEDAWDRSILPELEEYIRIPALSPHFDEGWAEHGHLDKAVEHIRSWCARQPVQGLSVEVVRLDGRTPVLWMEVPAFAGPGASAGAPGGDRTVLLYGHLDKQPEMEGWDPDKAPFKPVRVGDKLYGRGGADDGYAAYASLTAIAALQAQGIPHARCVILIEACEESGSFDLPAYVAHLRPNLGTPDLVVCLDSGCGNYDQLWCTTSLRGLVTGFLRVDVLEAPGDDGAVGGVHSGDAGGVVPSSFRILRKLLDRIEDPETGLLTLPQLNATIPEARKAQAERAADTLGDGVWRKYPFLDGVRPQAVGADAVLARTWRPALEVVGMGQMPGLSAGNVLRSTTTAKLSMRLPPTVDGETAAQAVKAALEADPPHRARVRFEIESFATGWDAPPVAEWVETSLGRASEAFFGPPAAFMGEGGSIPFMGMLGAEFPGAQFVITGLLGPGSNAHGPNEFLHVPTGKRLTMAMAQVLADHFQAPPPR